MISVIIPVYNQANKINNCIESILGQKIIDLEIIVVDDGSTDNITEVLSSWTSKIKLIQQENRGAPAARNAGFALSQGDYIIFCDADVVMAEDMLQKMKTSLDSDENIGFAYSSFKFGWKVFRLWPFDMDKLKKMPYIHSTSLIRREYFPGWDESLKKFQDWDLYLTISEAGHPGIWIDEVLFEVATKGTMSNWLPKFLYKLPWLKSVKKYKSAMEIIKKKHS